MRGRFLAKGKGLGKPVKKGERIKLISAATYDCGFWSQALKHSGIEYSLERNKNRPGENNMCYNKL